MRIFKGRNASVLSSGITAGLPPFAAVVEKGYKTMLWMAELHLNILAYPQRSLSEYFA